jgi:hypothetical protein
LSRTWFLQANPKLYDIDGALAVRDQIWWRVPQYTSEVHVGDVVVLWRSGPDAGAIGVGRVVDEPQLLTEPDPDDAAFIREVADWSATTQARIQVRPTSFVSKEQVAALDSFTEHPIVVAPMGTVFPIDEAAWPDLAARLAEPPPPVEVGESDLPRAFHWRERSKGVLPMPGGYDGYLTSLRSVCELIDTERPSKSELPARMEALLGVTANAARHRESFLRKMGVVQIEGGICQLSDWARRWYDSSDDRIIVALLHSRCQLIGELLDACREPRSVDELRAEANSRFGMGWDTATQINNRRGWLQSAGMLTALDDRRIQLTEAGAALLARLDLFRPDSSDADEALTAVDAPSAVEPDTAPDILGDEPLPAMSGTGDRLDSLAEELTAASTDSSDPDRFERAVRDAFEWLGFRAEWLGGSGKTDVLLDALLGRDDSYRVIIDCKTSGNGSVGDHQIDWVTLAEHRRQHDADHVLLVAPNPSGRRLFDRAKDQDVAVMSADQLVGVCRQHGRAPLSLDDYRELFQHGGAVDTTVIDERADEAAQDLDLAVAISDTVRVRAETFGRLTARDLFLILADHPVADGLAEDRIQVLLDALSNPLLAVLEGNPSFGYRATSSSATAELRLHLIGERIANSG